MIDRVELKDIRTFVQISRAGSLTRAAMETNLPKASLSHNLRRLEDTLEVELFVRSARGLSLTDAGRAYLEQCSRIFESCEIAANAAQRAHSAVSGKLRIAASAEFGTSILGAATVYLARAHPDIQFELRMYPSDTILTQQPDFDCMIYVGTAPDSDHLCRKLGEVEYGLFASPTFLAKNGVPTTPDDISKLPGVDYSRSGITEQWIIGQGKQKEAVDFIPRFGVNDYWMAKYYAVLGEAIAYLPDFFVHYEVKNGALKRVLADSQSEKIAAWIVYPSSRYNNPRVKLLVDTMCSRFEDIILHPGYSLVMQDLPTPRSIG